MKYILSLIISGALAVSGYSQTRNVLVNSNNAVVSPTNFWSVDASNARTGLGLGTAATNPASAFQPSSATLSNLASNNAVNLTNLRATNIVGTIPATNIGSLTLTNISGTLAITSGGTGATNAATARTNLGATTIGNALFTATNSAAAINAIGISTNFSDQILSVSNIVVGAFPASSFGFVVPTSGKTLTIRGTNLTTSVPAFFGWDGFSQTAFSAAEARTNLGLNAWTTNTNSPVFVDTNGEVVSPTNFWQEAPIVAQFIESQPTTNSTTNIVGARLLHIHSLATNIVNVTNTIVLPTNGTSFAGDIALVVHQGPTNSMTRVRQAGSTNDLITMTRFDEAVEFVYYENEWQLNHNVAFVEPIYFSGTNAAANVAASRTNLELGASNQVTFDIITANSAIIGTPVIQFLNQGLVLFDGDDAMQFFTNRISFFEPIDFDNSSLASATRTNLGIPLAALTNTNNATFQEAIFTTNAAPTNAGNFGDHVAWMGVSIVTNGVTNVFKIPLYK